jgi:hypothetical protein
MDPGAKNHGKSMPLRWVRIWTQGLSRNAWEWPGYIPGLSSCPFRAVAPENRAVENPRKGSTAFFFSWPCAAARHFFYGGIRINLFMAMSLRPPRRKKKSTAEYAEIAELFLGKDKKYKSFYGYGLLFAFPSSGDEDQRMNGEEAESAEIAP